MFALCRRTRVPLPEVNQWVDLGDGDPPIKADFLWRKHRVILETDGAKFHGTHQARQRDPRRDQRAMLAGWRPIRTTWRQVVHRPRELETTLPRLLAL
jgi:very-short-patch-repair endonuclease